MNWISALNNALEYIENNLENDVKIKKTLKSKFQRFF